MLIPKVISFSQAEVLAENLPFQQLVLAFGYGCSKVSPQGLRWCASSQYYVQVLDLRGFIISLFNKYSMAMECDFFYTATVSGPNYAFPNYNFKRFIVIGLIKTEVVLVFHKKEKE